MEPMKEHILVCLSSAPSNAKIIRTAARMAQAFQGSFTALFVQTPDFENLAEADKARLRSHIRLAEQLGASIETVYGEDVSYQIAEYARLSGVTKIVIGRSTVTRRRLFGKPTLTEKLIAIAPNLDIHIIPDAGADSGFYKKKARQKLSLRALVRDMAVTAAMLALATLIGTAFSGWGFSEANIITVYLLASVISAVVTSSRICSFLSSIGSVLVFNFFFTTPKYTLLAYDNGYPVTFFTMFIAAMIAGSLADRLKSQAKQSAQAAYRTNLLLETNQLLQKAMSDEDIFHAAAGQLKKLLGRELILCQVEDHTLGSLHISTSDQIEKTFQAEQKVVEWVLSHNKRAGANTDHFPSAQNMYLAIRVNERIYGIIGIDAAGNPLDAFENSVMISILGECALALENSTNAREKEAAKLVAQNEQLRANLLRSISHDLRTPLTSISGNASNLLSNPQSFDDGTRQQIYQDIYDDSMWLINLVENLLAVTRIEEGNMKLRLSTELIDDAINEALRHLNQRGASHIITAESSDDLLLARMDARLIVQVIINLVDNAIKYTPAGSQITLSSRKDGRQVVVSIADNGPGIPDSEKSKVFQMFYSGSNPIADSRRSMGLGLALCKSIINAHGGQITLSDNVPHGAVFTFTLPAGEVQIHE